MIGTNFVGTHASESGSLPPDSVGAVGPTQVMVLSNGRFKVFDKDGNPGGLNVSDSVFFASVRETPATGVSDPHVRYDRLSGRWFITEITVRFPTNRILIAVSSGSTITSTSSFTFFQFQQDQVGPTPNVDTNAFADYDTLGVDANALYIGANMFGAGSSMTGFVVNKTNLLAGTLTVTAFRGLRDVSFHGPFSPQGVDNDDPAATEGYFIGVDFIDFGRLTMRRVINPGGTPSISGNILITVPATIFPRHFSQPAALSEVPLDAIDDRLFAAMIKKNKITGVSSLWTAHTIGVNSSGIADFSPTRNGARWYQLDNLTTTPTLAQSGTLFDSSSDSSMKKGYVMPSVAANGRGDMALIASFASPSDFAGIAAAGRLRTDPLGATAPPSVVINGAAAYNSSCAFCLPERWGDYSQVVVDPTDDQTMWAFQEYAFSTDPFDAWAVRAIKLIAPPPATPVSASPSAVPRDSLTSVTITGTATGGSGFFDPGPGFANHLSGFVTGGVMVNSTTFVNDTTVTLNISTVSATPGCKNVTVSNPDGQQRTGNCLFRVTGTPPDGDVDGDRKTDSIVWRPSTGQWWIRLSSGGIASYTLGTSGDVPVRGDYDGDGKTDIVVWRPSTGQWFILLSSTNFTSLAAFSLGTSGDIPAPGDYDGDGKTDIAVWRPSTGEWLILLSSVNFTGPVTYSWGMSGDIPVPSDYDGDGKTDIVVWRPSTGQWLILLSSTNFTSSVTLSFGTGGDVPVPGDYDGDGKTDVAVWRPSTGQWFVLLSGINPTSFAMYSWGTSGDIPVPGDYDGDRKTDIAVWRPSTGAWFILLSSTNFTSSDTFSWGTSGDIPVLKRP
jgi:hypothetical protein